MPFRARMKRAFTRSSSSSSSDASHSLSKPASRGLGDPKIYQPGEPMPRPKYRAPVDKKHKAMLDSFTFSDSPRRKSTSSTGSHYSPMGSRIPSRHNSIHRPTGWWSPTVVDKVIEDVIDDTDVSNVISPALKSSSKPLPSLPQRSIGDPIAKMGGVQHIDLFLSSPMAEDHTPFSEIELEEALRRGVAKASSPTPL